MSISSYEGPQGGDYVRYVDQILRSNPLYRASAQALTAGTRSDFTGADALQTPGAQPASAMARVRERAQAAVVQAKAQTQREAQAAGRPAQQTVPSSSGAQRKPRRPRLELESEQAARREAQALAAARSERAYSVKKSWFRITPGRIFFVIVLAILGMTVPGLGAMVLLFTIINAVRSGIQSAKASS